MSNTPPPQETEQAKPAWTRCAACKTRLWNDRIDIEVHRQTCPADLQRALRRLSKALEKASARIEELERRPLPHVVEPAVGPALDFEHEAPWPEGEPAPEPDDDDDDEDDLPQVASATGPVAVPSLSTDDDDDEYDLPGRVGQPFMR